MDTQELPNITGKGVAPIRIDELDQLADIYMHQRDKLVKAKLQHDDARTDLIDAMHKHCEQLSTPNGLSYRLTDMTLIIVTDGKEQLKVIQPK
jgi:hypothetical protein